MDDDPIENQEAGPHRELASRVEWLENRLSRIEAALGLAEEVLSSESDMPPPPTAADRIVAPSAGVGPAPHSPPPPRPAPRTWPDAEVLLKWAGVALVFLAGVFAVSTGVDRGWIGPELQLAGALTGGIGLIVYGLRLDRVRPPWGHALVHTGLGVLFTTSGAAHGWLELAPLWTAVAGASVVAVVGLVLARHLDREALGFNALAGFLLVPLLLEVWDTWTATLLAAGLGAVAVAVTGLAIERRWVGLRVATAFAVGALFLPLAGWTNSDGTQTDELAVTLVAAGLAALWWALPIAALWQRVSALGISAGLPTASREPEALEARLTLGVPAWAWSVPAIVWFDASERDAGFFAWAVAIGFLGLALIAQPWCRRSHWLGQLVGVSILATIGLAMATSGDVVLAGLTVQALGLLVVARALDDDLLLMVNAGILGLVAAPMTVGLMAEAVANDASFLSDLTYLAAVAALAASVYVLRDLREIRWMAALVLAAMMLWLLATLVHLPQGHVAVSITWAALGIGVLLAGAVLQRTDVGSAGLVVLAVTMAKLFMVDLSEVDTFWRAGLFLVVGAGILRLGYALPALTGSDQDEADPEDAGVDTIDTVRAFD